MSVAQGSILTRKVDAALGKGVIVKKGASSDSNVQKATASTDKMYGITQDVTTAADQATQVAVDGPAEVKLAEAMVAGDPFTSDADGYAILPNAANENTMGFVVQDGAIGDIVACIVVKGKATQSES